MPELMEFIGREEEVTHVDSLINKTTMRAVVFVRGAGGLGKTRLLQEIRRAYVGKGEFLTTDIIDFDDRLLRTFEGLEIKFADEIGVAAEVAAEIQQLRTLRSGGAIKKILEAQQQIITNILKSQFNHLSKKQRVLFFFDTVEKVEESNLRSLFSLLDDFGNGVFLFAGRPFAESPRPTVDIPQLMKDYFGEEACVIDVKPLDQAKSGEYLRAKLRTINIKDEQVQNLLTMVEGRPILIELTAQWLSIAQPPDWLLKELHSLSNEDLKEKQKDFKANLVRHITQLRTPMDRLLLVLSRVYPFDVEMAEELLGLSREDAEMLVESAKKYVFVKTLPGAKITLHDEMRAMVNEFVWPFNDKTGERKRRDSRRAATIFEERVNNLASNQQKEAYVVRGTQYEEQRRIEQVALIEQWVEHALFADIASGCDVLDTAWNRAIESKDYELAERILEIAAPFSGQFTNEQQFDYDVLRARLNNFTGHDVEDSMKLLRKWAKLYAKEPSCLSTIYNALGRAERISGNLKDAVRYLSKNLRIIKDTNPSRAPHVANQLGYTYRLMGNLEKAESAYKSALELAMETEKHDRDLIASLLNNLGYIYGVQKKYDIAENYCLQAADIWNDIGLISEVGRVDISLGILYRDRGNYEEAIKLLDQAEGRVSGSRDYERIGRAHFHLAWAKWFKWEEINKIVVLDWDETKKKDGFIDIELLIEAKNDFDSSLDMAESGAPQLLPGILHQMSNVYWWLGWLRDEQYKSKARELNTRAYEESEQRNNIRYSIDSLVGDAEFDYDMREYRKIPEYAKKLQTRYGRMEEEYSLYFGRIIRILGDVAFSEGQYNEALMQYTNALPKIQRHGGFGKYSTRLELLRLERKLDKLPISEVNMWLEHFLDHWKKRVELIHWCEKERLRARLRVN